MVKESVVIVRDHLPLQQGLRPNASSNAESQSGLRPSSITTRIKTISLRLRLCLLMLGQRPSSITTRIKTLFFLPHRTISNQVRDHLPLQQGLRRLSGS